MKEYMLEKMMIRQKEFQYNFYNVDSLSHADRIYWTKEFVFCLHQELSEVMNSVDWKVYHHKKDEFSVDHTKEEIIDCFKFVLNLMIVWGIDAKELETLFNQKSDIVEKRLTMKK